MNDYRVNKIETAVTLFLSDGVVHEGLLFLSPVSLTHSGPQRLIELFLEPEAFCPFKEKNDRFCLINKNAVAYARYYPAQDEEEIFGDQIKVRLNFYGGEILEGIIVVSMPADKGRIQDYINSTSGFFCLYTEAAHYVVNGDLIREITPL